MAAVFDIRKRLSAKENFIEFCPRKNFKAYITTLYDEGRGGLQEEH
jgi:hypothetical protein